jgi:hypothetical protein
MAEMVHLPPILLGLLFLAPALAAVGLAFCLACLVNWTGWPAAIAITTICAVVHYVVNSITM